MGHIYYIMGKSASGKDTIYREICRRMPELHTVIMYTTRPRRQGEEDGKEYYFIAAEEMKKLKEQGNVIESRTYETVAGPWSYFTVNDGQFDVDGDILMIGTLESYESMLMYFGPNRMRPLFIHVEDGVRLSRAVKREQEQKTPKYAELCRRYLADEEDFCPARMERCHIVKQFENEDAHRCADLIMQEIAGEKQGRNQSGKESFL